jgi:hypothetical protein
LAPEFAANVAAFWTASNVDNDAEDDEPNDSSDLDDGEHELSFTVSFDPMKNQSAINTSSR